MITVHILEANLKGLPGKITLLVTEPLTHSLPLPPGQQSSLLQREEERGNASCLQCTVSPQHSRRMDNISERQTWVTGLAG